MPGVRALGRQLYFFAWGATCTWTRTKNQLLVLLIMPTGITNHAQELPEGKRAHPG